MTEEHAETSSENHSFNPIIQYDTRYVRRTYQRNVQLLCALEPGVHKPCLTFVGRPPFGRGVSHGVDNAT